MSTKSSVMIKSHSLGDHIFVVINYLFLGIIGLICLYPVWHVLMASFSNPARLMVHSGVLLAPEGFSLEGYKAVLSNKNVGKGYINTLFYTSVGTLYSLFLTSLGAYVTSRKKLMLKKFMLPFIVLTMYISAGMIPEFLLIKNLGLYNSRLAVILPSAITTSNLIVMRTAFLQVPAGLEESAKIDGAGDWTILWKIIMPVTKATFAVITLYYMVGRWNSWFNAMIYLQDRNKYPLQLFLQEILLANSTVVEGSMGDYNRLDQLIKYCTIIVSTAPILCIYPFVQKYFVTGVMMGSIKE